ncbi:MAG: NAD-dependent DNA ligase LigA [Clostridia bacterium]|nr:NAD-dependent DNA ligase LigA [Clostridia bacterium]
MLDRMKLLVKKLNEYSNAYYYSNEPVVSDAEFDALMDELKVLENETGVILPNSPTVNVGANTPEAFKPHTHIARLWSLDKVRSEGEIREWAQRCQKASGNSSDLDFLLEYKFDGLTINLTYDNGILVQAATRGNGIVGEGILNQARTIASIPKEVLYKGKFEVRGECYMRLSVLEMLNQTGSEQLKNARNAAAGAIRNLDPSVTASRKLDCACYNVGYIEGKTFSTRFEMYDFMRDNGLPVSDYVFSGNLDALISEICAVTEKRSKLDFLIDGLVIKLNYLALFHEMGYTDKFPRGEIAYKFAAEELITTVNDITWEVGRTGKLTPLAHLSPIEFEGVTVRKATLNNYDDILRKNVGIGSRVLVRRSNDVIPEILKSVDDTPPERPTRIPEFCPACGAKIERRGVHAFCTNSLSCKPQIVGRIEHFASRDAMDIEGFSEKTAELLVDKLSISSIPEIYELDEMSFSSLAGFGSKKTANILNSIEKSKDCKLEAFIYALGIPNVGSKTASDLAREFKSFDALRVASRDALISIPDVGEIVADSIIDFFADAHITAQINKLLELGVCPREAKSVGSDVFITGKTFVVTGALERMDRKQIEDFIIARGGRASGSVSKKTDYVIAGENAGSKLQKARELGVPVLTENAFFERIESK